MSAADCAECRESDVLSGCEDEEIGMGIDLNSRLVVGVSTRTLFDLSIENSIFERDGLEAYCRYQIAHEEDILRPGPGFALIKALLAINDLTGQKERVEVIIMSHNNADTSVRFFRSIAYYGLHITRAVFSGGSPLTPYLNAFKTDLFLSANEGDVQQAVDSGIAAGIICMDTSRCYDADACVDQIRIAFDGDAVLFLDESEEIFQKEGLEAFEESERQAARRPLAEGPFAKFLKTVSALQQEFAGGKVPIRTALVTSRCAPAHERVVRTLRAWNVRIDESFFLGGVSKRDILAAFGAHIFFDDQDIHTRRAAEVVPAARVPGRRRAG